MKAKQFYRACLDHKLAERDIINFTKGKKQQKLAVLPHLADVLYNNCMIGYSINNGVYLQADYFVGNTRSECTYLSKGQHVDRLKLDKNAKT